MSRIALAGVQHETNTFAPTPTDFDRFLEPDAWPGLVEGQAVLDSVAGANIPVAGFAAETAGRHTLLPLVWCAAGPGGVVTDEAFEAIWQRLERRLLAAGHCDALYLDLHGAMVTQSHADAEGELLRRLRALTGPSLPIVASLDFHANVSRQMVELADGLVGYRTYPHIDMADTGRRTARLLERLLDGDRLTPGFVNRLPMSALTWQTTLSEPMRSIMHRAEALECASGSSVSVFAGFPLADVEEAGVSVLVYASRQAEASETMATLADSLSRASARKMRIYGAREAVASAASHHDGNGPVILADVQDNPGAGGTGRTTHLLYHILEAEPGKSAFGVLCDPEAAAIAHTRGPGARLRMQLDASGTASGGPALETVFEVVGLGNGCFVGVGPFYGGCRFDLGAMACLRRGRTDVVVSSRPQQAADRAMFQHVGIEPAAYDVLALKSAVHFRADFGHLASAGPSSILIVAAGGLNPIDLADLAYRKAKPTPFFLPSGPAVAQSAATAALAELKVASDRRDPPRKVRTETKD